MRFTTQALEPTAKTTTRDDISLAGKAEVVKKPVWAAAEAQFVAINTGAQQITSLTSTHLESPSWKLACCLSDDQDTVEL